MSDDEIRDKLRHAIQTVKEIIDGEKESGTLQPDYETYGHWNVTSFKYDDEGVVVNKNGSYIQKPIWIHASVNVLNKIKKTELIRNISDFLKNRYEIKEGSPNFGIFIQKIIGLYLQKENLTESEVNKLIETFILELNDKPISVRANIQLVGLILHPDEIEICEGVRLKKPKKEDFEIDIPIFGFGFDPHTHYINPTAFLEISIPARQPIDFQREVVKAETILRLFKLGSVRVTSYQIYPDSISRFFGGSFGSMQLFAVLEKYIILEEDVENLKKNWGVLYRKMPSFLYEFIPKTMEVDHISIAYSSFSASLIESGIEEQRIANVIIGLEALFLKSEKERNKSNQLSRRIAQLLSLSPTDSRKIRRVINDAYEVRSIFLHGSRLKNSDRHMVLLKRYNDNPHELLKLILEYIRKSLLIFLTVEMSKDKIILLLDNSLISTKDDNELKQRLKNCICS
jgi:hypothetical protein